MNEIENAFKHFAEDIYPLLETSDYKKEVRLYITRFRSKGLYSGKGSLGIQKAVEILTAYGYKIGIHKPTEIEANQFFKQNQRSMKRNMNNDDIRKKAEENEERIKD